MITEDLVPNWFVDNYDVVGPERAPEYIAWVLAHRGPLLDEARYLIERRYGPGEIEVTMTDLETLSARQWIPDMVGFGVGKVSRSLPDGAVAEMHLVLRREGRMRLMRGVNMR